MSFESVIDTLEIRNANKISFVGTSSSFIDTITGRIQTKGIQHNSNVITDVSGPHGRGVATLKKYPEFIFEEGEFEANDSTKTYVRAGYTVSSSSTFVSGTDARVAWRAFDGNADGSGNPPNIWQTHYANTFDTNSPYGIHTNNTTKGTFTADGVTYIGEWIKLKLPHKIKLNYLKWETSIDARRPKKGAILGSNNNSDWYTVKAFDNDLVWTVDNVADYAHITSSSNSAYTYFMVVIEQVQGGDGSCWGNQISLYGYEDLATQGDHSVDTTFKSRFNNAQTTGVQVLVDGNAGQLGANQISGGPDPSGNQSTYVTDGKYWTLNGTLTSNLSVEANTFLEGDQPHAVSVWFNSSNLEANVSNTCVFSISDQEKLDSVNLDLQSNTWHNLTYAYQGEGGSRVTYLDGRKVSEDQAEDTFGDYPPFAMTGYSQGGYVVSASSEGSSGTRNAFKAFDKTAPLAFSAWSTDGGFTSGVYSSGGSSFTLNGSPESGHWLKIELPHKLHVSYVEIIENNNAGFKPTSGFLIGSNDDQNWDVLKQYSGLTYPASDYKATIVSESSKAYKYILLLIQTLDTNTGTYTFIEDFHIYGHRENDLVRLPDPTNVLKYPHITLDTSNGIGMYNKPAAKRGYVVTASTYGAASREPVLAFDGDTSTLWYGGFFTDSGGAEGSSPNQFFLADGSGQTITDASSTVHYGSWLTLELPHKLQVSSIKIRSTGNSNDARRRFKGGKLFGSNTHNPTSGTISGNYYQLGSRFDFATSSTDEATFTINATTAYKYITLLGDSCWYDGTNDEKQFYIHDYQIFGIGVDSIPIQIGGGNIDKVANFRVYDKFVGEDQALEIWNAQKEEFGRAKPQMVLQQGKLGIGTDAPQGSLSVADEPHNVEEFPPGPMNGYKNYFEGHGEFCVINSTFQSGGQEGWKAFDGVYGVPGNGNIWISGNPTYNTDGTSNGTSSINGEAGEYLILEMPYNVKMKSVLVYPRGANSSTVSYSNPPKNGKIWGKNGIDSVWEELTEYSNLDFGATITDNLDGQYPQEIQINAVKAYKYIAFQVQVSNHTLSDNSTYTNIRQLRYFGTREQGQSILHDGQLTLTKNLNVPRIGPPLDADDTPRRDRLVVEYNTSTNPTFEGAVRDTSGRRLDGVFTTGASYDAIKKALTFNGATTSGISIGGATGVGGDRPFSVSLWFNASALTGGVDNVLVGWGAQASQESFLMSFDTTNNQVLGQFYGNAMSVSPSGGINLGNWYHAVLTYPGGGHYNMSIYVNGVKGTNTNYGTNLGGLVPEDSEITIGTYKNTSNQGFNGSISNFKLYDTALTAKEVKTLYDMGRCDEGHHVVNFSKTRVGIGLGDGEVSDALLNVGGVPYGAGVRPIFSAYEYDGYVFEGLNNSQNNVILGNTFINHNNAYNTSTGVFTVPVTGEYHIFACCQWRGFSNYNQGVKSGSINFVINDVGWNPTSTTRPVVTQTIRYANECKQLNGSLVIKLNKGDQLKVQCTNNLTQNVGDLSWGQGYGRFAAFLLS